LRPETISYFDAQADRRDGFASDARFTHLKRPAIASVKRYYKQLVVAITSINEAIEYQYDEMKNIVVSNHLNIIVPIFQVTEVLTKRFAYVRENDNRHRDVSVLTLCFSNITVSTWRNRS